MKQLITDKRRLLTLLLACFITAFFLPLTPSLAAENDNTSSSTELQNQHVYDNAKLLSTIETKDLEQLCMDKGKDSGIDIMLLTKGDTDSSDPERFIEDFEDQLPRGDRVYILIDMGSRTIMVQGYGDAKKYINAARSQKITDNMASYVTQEDYYDAFSLSIDQSADYMKHKPVNLIENIWLQLLVSLIIGGSVVGIMAYNSGGRMTAGGNTYMDPNHSGLIGRRDDYLHTQVTRIRKPKNNGSGGGISPGGRSHSTGSTRF